MSPASSIKTCKPMCFCLLAVAFVIFLLCAPDVFAAITKQEWLMEMRHRQLGDFTVYVSNDAVRMVNKSSGYQVLSKAPDWDVITFRVDDKKMHRVKRSIYCQGNNYTPVDNKPDSTRLKQKGIGYVDKIKVDILTNGYEDFWVISSFGLAPQVTAIPQLEYSTLPLHGLLVRYTVSLSGKDAPDRPRPDFFSSDGKHVFVITKSIKPVPYNAADFAVPVGYKSEPRRDHLVTSEQSRAGADDILRELGLGDKLGRSAR